MYYYALERTNDSNSTYYVYNGHGDVAQLANYVGGITKNYTYDAFGNEVSPTAGDTNPFRYCGEYFDTQSGTYYLRARYYNPSVGRFTTEDPINSGLNWYAYCASNPVMFVDPWGLIPTPLEAAYISKHIYNYDKDNSYEERQVKDENGNLIGWRLIDSYEGRQGMKVGVYIPDGDDWENPSEYVIAFRGSIIKFNMETVYVWINNLEQHFSSNSADMWDAINYATDFVNSHSETEITFVGHSKGGSEALAAAVATGRNAIVFNPAVPNLSGYNLSENDYTGTATSYIVRGEILNDLIGEPGVGNVIYLKQMYTSPNLPIYYPYVTNAGFYGSFTMVRVAFSIQNHGIKTVIWALEEE